MQIKNSNFYSVEVSSLTSLSGETTAALGAQGGGAVDQLRKQSHIQSECHGSEMLQQVAGLRCQTTTLLGHLQIGSEQCLSHE